MSVPDITLVALTPPRPEPRPLLVVGPSVGTAVATLWSEVAARLDRDVVGWELPGHGRGAPASGPFSVAELAAGVLRAVDELQAERGEGGRPFDHAGDSLGGAVGLQLALDAPARLATLTMVCSCARFGTEDAWRERAATVRASGTSALITGSAQRWFAPGFVDRRPETASALLHDLRDADAASYAWCADALAVWDLRGRLHEVRTPTLVVSGAVDPAVTAEQGREVADGVRLGHLVELDGVAHQAPVEAPQRTADAIARHLAGAATAHDTYAAGMTVRREVLGAAHVDRANAAVDDVTRDFQDLITRYAWGTIWTRPGLDRRSRSMITLTALVAGGHLDELGMHVRAAVGNGLSRDEISEVLLQAAVYCGVPAANSAFRVAREVLAELDAETTSSNRQETNP